MSEENRGGRETGIRTTNLAGEVELDGLDANVLGTSSHRKDMD